ncbi:Dbl homology domain-containing protein [Aspergillus tetrazonus]
MDFLSISASVAGLTASCVQTAKALHDLKDKFDNANLTISAICTETTLISASMTHIQSHLLRDPKSVLDKLHSQPSLESTLDQALTGCYLVFDVLQSEVSKLTESALPEAPIDLRFTAKVRYMWNESTMKDVLNQMRGLQTALTLLLQLLGVDTIVELKQMMDQNMTILGEVAQHTSRISSSANKAPRAPRSIYDMSFRTFSISDGGSSLYSSKLFEFDDEVVNSAVYRQTLAKAYARERAVQESTNGAGEVSEAAAIQRTSGASTPTPAKLGNGEEGEGNRTAASLSMSKTNEPLKQFLHKDYNVLAWGDQWALKPEDLASVPSKEVNRQNLLHEIITTEEGFLKSTQVIHYLYYHRLALHPSTIVSSGSNQEFAEQYFGFHERFYHLHKTFLYDPLIERQKAEGPWVTNHADIFQQWLLEATPIYLEFSALYPQLHSVVQAEASSQDPSFNTFLTQSMDHKASVRLPWSTHMKAPITRIQRYTLLLRVVLECSDPHNERHRYHATQEIINDIRELVQKCETEIAKAQNNVRVNKLSAQLGPTLSSRVISPNASILFDDLLWQPKRGLSRAAPLRIVVIVYPLTGPRLLVLNPLPQPKHIIDDGASYVLVKQVSQFSQNYKMLSVTSS